MLDQDKPDFFARLNGLQEVYGKPKITPAAAQIWWDTVRELDHNDVFGVLGYWAQSNTKPPAPADVWRVSNDKRTHRLEEKSERERAQNRGNPADQWHGATPYGREMLRRIVDMLEHPQPQRPWPEKALARVHAGEALPFITRKWAADWFRKQGRDDDALAVSA